MPLTQVSSRAIEDTLRYVLGANGTSHYTFTGKGLNGAVNDPTLTLSRGHTYIFENRNSNGAHPFYIKTSIANGGTNDAYNTGVTNNGGAGGTEIIFTVPHDAPDVLYYQCSSHINMAGQLNIAGSVADGSITTSKLSNDCVTNAQIADNAIQTENILNEQVTLAKLEHGTSSNDGKFLRANNGADPSFESIPSGTTINNNAANKVITGDANSDTLNADPNVLINSGKVSTGGETSPDVGAGGLCLQKGTDSNKALTIKNTNVAHGVTTYDETDTFLSIGQCSGNRGGAEIRGYTDATPNASSDPAIRLRGIIASDADHTYTPLVFLGAEANGSGVQNIAADRRIATFQNADGSRIVNITGTGITFGDEHAANFALDDYEEGTYTPVIRGHQGWSAAHNEQHGNYVKIGGMCYVSIRIQTSNMNSISASSYLECSLPFNSATISGHTVGTLMCSEWSISSQNISWMGGNVMSNSQYVRMHYHNGSNNNTNQMTKGNVNNTLQFRGTVVYRVP